LIQVLKGTRMGGLAGVKEGCKGDHQGDSQETQTHGYGV